MRVIVLGATSSLGVHVLKRLAARRHDGFTLVAQGRDRARLLPLRALADCRSCDIEDAAGLHALLEGATHVASCVPISYGAQILAALPQSLTRLAAIGSTRVYSRYPTAFDHERAAGKAILLESGRPVIVLEPTMIYGGHREINLRRLAAIIRRFPVLPLPGGGRALVQPVFVEDVARATEEALFRPLAPGAIIVAGAEPLAYAALVRAVAAVNSRRVIVLPLPISAALWIAKLARAVPGLPHIRDDELLRTSEDRAFDIADMRALLGVEPLPLADGLSRAFAQPAESA